MKLLTFMIVTVTTVSAYTRYDGYQVLRTIPSTQRQIELLRSLEKKSGQIDISFWKSPSKLGRPVDIMLDSAKVNVFLDRLQAAGMEPEITIQNVQTLVDADVKHMIEHSQRSFSVGDNFVDITLTDYHSTDEIYAWLDAVAQAQPSIASTFSIGKSHEGRDMKGIKIGSPGTNKPGYWIDGGIHAREWIAPATAVYIIYQLVNNYASDPATKRLVDGIDFYILPVANPDGYEYTRSSDRMWRKTRSGPRKSGGFFSRSCYGVDPNRNWPFKWMVSGTSKDPCDDTYGGPSAWSEIECANMGNFLQANKATLQAYISLHSYAQDWMYSYGYADNTYPPDVADLKTLANEGAAALKAVHGTVYDVGSPTDILYAASGASDDWSKSIGIKWVYTLELRDTGTYGFQLPANQIVPTGEETWAGLQVIAEKILSA